jgi:hypothetical protein
LSGTVGDRDSTWCSRVTGTFPSSCASTTRSAILLFPAFGLAWDAVLVFSAVQPAPTDGIAAVWLRGIPTLNVEC